MSDEENTSVEVYVNSVMVMCSVRFNEEFNWVASGSMDCSVIIYDYDSNRVI